MPDQQEGRRPVPQRRRRQRLGRQGAAASRSRSRQMGYTLSIRAASRTCTQDFSAQIAAFKKDNVEIVTGVVIPPDAKTFLTQARQQGFKPKVVTLGKALLFPGAIEALGDLGDGLTTEVWWSPSHPFTSSLTKQSAKALAEAYEAGDEEAVDAADRLRPRAVRGRGRRAQAHARASAAKARARCDRGDQPQHRRRRRQVGRPGPVQERQQDAAGARPVGARARSTSTSWSIVNNQTAPNIPTGGTIKPDGLTPAPLSESQDLLRCRCSLLALASASRYGALKVTDAHLARGRRGRDARHPRPERRRQDDAVQPDHAATCAPTPGACTSRAATSRRCRRTGAAARGIGRTYQMPQPFGAHDRVREPASPPPASAAGMREREAWRHCARGAARRPGCCAHANALGRRADACSTASAWSWRARWRRGPKLLLLDEIAGGLTEHEARRAGRRAEAHQGRTA